MAIKLGKTLSWNRFLLLVILLQHNNLEMNFNTMRVKMYKLSPILTMAKVVFNSSIVLKFDLAHFLDVQFQKKG